MASISKRTTRRVVIDERTGRQKSLTIERYRARYRDEAGVEHARHFSKKVDAQRWLDDTTAGLVRGDWVDPAAGRITFAQWWGQWTASQDWVAGTAATADQVLASISFGQVPIRAVTENHVRQWMKAQRLPGPKRKRGLAASTRRTRFNYVRMCFAAAVRARLIRLDPTAAIAPPKVPKAETKMRIPTAEQVAQALIVAPPEFRAFLAVCAFAGLRLGEAAGVQLGDIDFLRRTLRVERQIQGQVNSKTAETSPKYESARVIYLPDGLVTMLSQHLEKTAPHGDDGYLFSLRGYVYNRNSAGSQWRRVRKQVGMDEFTLHDLRHFYASGLIAAGCDVVTVQHALGHSAPSITLNTYSHLWPKAEDRTRSAAAGLMSMVFPEKTKNPADSVRTRGIY